MGYIQPTIRQYSQGQFWKYGYNIFIFFNLLFYISEILLQGFYYDVQEILPFVNGDFRFNKSGEKVSKFSSLEVEVRALIEGQFLSKRSYAEEIGLVIGSLYNNFLSHGFKFVTF